MVDLDVVVATCRAALAEPDPGAAVAEALRPVVADGGSLSAAVEPRRGAPGAPVVLHRADDLTVLALEVAPGFVSPPHNHTIWAVVGVYEGNEDNVFYRRTAGGIEETGRAVLHRGESLALPADAVHRISNTGSTPLRAIHVYGGDLFATARSQWDVETGEERPFG